MDSDTSRNRSVAAADLLRYSDRSVEAESAGEDRQTAEQVLLSRGQQLIAPVQCRAQRSVPCWRRTGPAGEQVEAFVEPLHG